MYLQDYCERKFEMNKLSKSVNKMSLRVCIIIGLSTLLSVQEGCNSDHQMTGKSGALLGTGIGALAGQAIGRNTTSTLIGAGVGAGVGYIIGNEQDKKAALNHNYSERTPLTGTKWQVTSLVMEDKPEYESITAEFRSDGMLVTTRFEPGGTKTITEEKYRVVGNTLIIHKADYIINAEYQIYGDELIVNCEQFRAVLSRT
jgi:hypothetical protein